MPTSYKYKYKPKGVGYSVWVTKQRHGKPQQSSHSSSILGDAIADVVAKAIVGAVFPPKEKIKTYKLV